MSKIGWSALLCLGMLGQAALAQVEPGNSAGVSMGHIHLTAKDPELHMKLWTQVLGGETVKAGPMSLVKFPGVLLAFRSGQSTGGTEGSVIDHLGFLVSDLAKTKEKLTGAGVKIVREMPETKQMFAMFPDDVKVEFSEDAKLTIPIRHHHVHFASDHVEEMRAWYADKFGAVPGMRARFKAADLPGVNLTWNESEKPLIASKGRAVDHIGFEVRDIAAFCKKLESSGAKIEMGPTEAKQLGLTVAFLTDPWGTRIELTEGLGKL